MIKVRFLEDCEGFKRGQIAYIDYTTKAQRLIGNGKAERIGNLPEKDNLNNNQFLSITEVANIICRSICGGVIEKFDWVRYTDFDIDFIRQIIEALPTENKFAFWDCVNSQYCKFASTKDYQENGESKADFEERLQMLNPTQQKAPSIDNRKRNKETFFDIFNENKLLQTIIKKAEKKGLLQFNPDGKSYWLKAEQDFDFFCDQMKEKIPKVSKVSIQRVFLNSKTDKKFANPSGNNTNYTCKDDILSLFSAK